MARLPVALTLLIPVVALACGGGGGSGPTAPTPPPAPQVVTVQIRDSVFEPKSVKINPGDTVRWVQMGSLAVHTVTADDPAFSSGAVFTSPGASFERRFDQTGKTILYYCTVHGSCCAMQGSIRVGNDAPEPPPGY